MISITWDTNYNGKLAASRFVHIDLAPEKMPEPRKLKSSVIQINVADKSHEPVTVQVDSIIPFRLGELSNIHTWPSHGMDTADFINWQHRRKGISQDTMLAVYYYKKVENPNY